MLILVSIEIYIKLKETNIIYIKYKKVIKVR